MLVPADQNLILVQDLTELVGYEKEQTLSSKKQIPVQILTKTSTSAVGPQVGSDLPITIFISHNQSGVTSHFQIHIDLWMPQQHLNQLQQLAFQIRAHLLVNHRNQWRLY